MLDHETATADTNDRWAPSPRQGRTRASGGRLLRFGLALALLGGGTVGLVDAGAVPAEAATGVIVDPTCDGAGVCTQTFARSGSVSLAELGWKPGSEITINAVGGRGGNANRATGGLGRWTSTRWTPNTTVFGGQVKWTLGGNGSDASENYAGDGGLGGGPDGWGAGGRGGKGDGSHPEAGAGGGGSTWVYGSTAAGFSPTGSDRVLVAPGGGGAAPYTGGGDAGNGGYAAGDCRAAPGTPTSSGAGMCDGASGSPQQGGNGAAYPLPGNAGSSATDGSLWGNTLHGGGGGGGGLNGGAGGGNQFALGRTVPGDFYAAGGAGGGASPGGTLGSTEGSTQVQLQWQRRSDAAVLNLGGLYHTHGAYGSWSQPGDLKSTAQFPNRAKRVAMTSTFKTEIQTLVADNTGAMYHSLRRADGTWTTAAAVNVGVPGLVVDVAGTGGQFVAVTADGRLWHMVRYSDGRWTQAGEPPTLSTNNTAIGPVTSVAATDAGHGEARFYVTTTAGQVWMLTRRENGSWTSAEKIDLNGAVARQVTAFVSASETQIAVVTASGGLLHNLRRTDGSWTGPGDAANASHITGRVTHVASTTTDPGRGEFLVSTSDGRLSRSIRYADGSWSSPDVLTTGIGINQTVTAAAAVCLRTQQLDVIAIG